MINKVIDFKDVKGIYDMFEINASGRKIYVPKASEYTYYQVECWRYYYWDIVGYDFND